MFLQKLKTNIQGLDLSFKILIQFFKCIVIFTECSNLTKAGLDITGDIACHIPSTCNSMTCCVQSDLLRRSLFTSIDLNTCLYTMTVTIEDFQHEIQLLNYKWGRFLFKIELLCHSCITC